MIMSPRNAGDEPLAPPAEQSAQVDEERREALRQMARFGAYTAPALLAMLSGEAHAQGSDPT